MWEVVPVSYGYSFHPWCSVVGNEFVGGEAVILVLQFDAVPYVEIHLSFVWERCLSAPASNIVVGVVEFQFSHKIPFIQLIVAAITVQRMLR